MQKIVKYEALPFFIVTFFISWIFWFLAIYASYKPSMHCFLLPLVLAGLSGPAIGTIFMLAKSKNKKMWHDFFQRLRPKTIKIQFIPIVLLFFPSIILLAIVVSLLFNQPIDQITFIKSADLLLQGKSFFTGLLVFVCIGVFEEIGWRGYGIDSLREKFNLLNTSLIFGSIWGIWHVPLFFIKNGGMQKEIWNVGLFQIVLYFTGLLLISIITNWLYAKNNRSILVAILFHSIYDFCLSIFHITPITFFILWVILFLTSLIVIKRDKDVFFTNRN